MTKITRKGSMALKIDQAITKAAHTAAPLFAANRWVWARLGPGGIPQEKDIAWTLRKMVESMGRGKEVERIATGRLVVQKYEGEEGAGLEFLIELADTGEVTE